MSFFFFFFLLPLPTAGKGLVLKARPRCLETATMLKKHSIMWLFGNVATASVRGAQLSALVNMFGTCAAAEQSSVYKYSEKHLDVHLPRVNMRCKEIYHLNMLIVLLIFEFHMQNIKHKLSRGVRCALFCSCMSTPDTHSLLIPFKSETSQLCLE